MRNRLFFSDEKIFVVEEKLNKENDRTYAAAIEDIPEVWTVSTLSVAYRVGQKSFVEIQRARAQQRKHVEG